MCIDRWTEIFTKCFFVSLLGNTDEKRDGVSNVAPCLWEIGIDGFSNEDWNDVNGIFGEDMIPRIFAAFV